MGVFLVLQVVLPPPLLEVRPLKKSLILCVSFPLMFLVVGPLRFYPPYTLGGPTTKKNPLFYVCLPLPMPYPRKNAIKRSLILGIAKSRKYFRIFIVRIWIRILYRNHIDPHQRGAVKTTFLRGKWSPPPPLADMSVDNESFFDGSPKCLWIQHLHSVSRWREDWTTWRSYQK